MPLDEPRAEASPLDTSPAARGERRRARTRSAILDAAEQVFRRDGYEAARIEEIAQRADLSVGSIYLHFDGKRALYVTLVERALDLFEQYMACIDDPAFSPLQRVLAGGDAYLQFHLDHPGLFHFLAHQTPHSDGSHDESVDVRIRDRVGGLLEAFAARIDDAVAAGEARPVDSRRLTRYTWGAWNGVIALGTQPTGLRLTDDEIAETLELGRLLLREALATPRLRDSKGEVGERVPLPRVTTASITDARSAGPSIYETEGQGFEPVPGASRRV